jgi:hypothetical protein
MQNNKIKTMGILEKVYEKKRLKAWINENLTALKGLLDKRQARANRRRLGFSV